jgi:hypothetical protein
MPLGGGFVHWMLRSAFTYTVSRLRRRCLVAGKVAAVYAGKVMRGCVVCGGSVPRSAPKGHSLGRSGMPAGRVGNHGKTRRGDR